MPTQLLPCSTQLLIERSEAWKRQMRTVVANRSALKRVRWRGCAAGEVCCCGQGARRAWGGPHASL